MVQTDGPVPDALWKLRYRLPIIQAQVARANPARALVASNRSGLYQLYYAVRTARIAGRAAHGGHIGASIFATGTPTSANGNAVHSPYI